MTTIRKNTNEPITNHVGLNGFQNHATNGSIHIHNKPLLVTNESNNTLGHHIAKRLVEIGINDVFTVPGDFNLTLLDYLVAEPEINLIGC
jgi:pyruvate decarboxylase